MQTLKVLIIVYIFKSRSFNLLTFELIFRDSIRKTVSNFHNKIHELYI
jgi:hypothetical protein